VHSTVETDLWSDLSSSPEAGQVRAFLAPMTPSPSQPRTYGTKKGILEDLDGRIDEPTFPEAENSSEEENDGQRYDELMILGKQIEKSRGPWIPKEIVQ
jgi:hypothetical protein